MLLFKTKQKIMQPLSWDQKKSRNLLGQKNHTTSQDIKKSRKNMPPLHTKKMMQLLKTKKVMQPLGKRKK